jgi:hypothetical protein
MWVRLGEVCEAPADAGEAETLVLWRELSGGLLDRACRSAVRDGELGQLTLASCVGHLASESLIGRLTPFLKEIREWEWHEAEDLVKEARRGIQSAIMAILALRCATGERVGAELLHWASVRCDPYHLADGNLYPVRANRPISWIEACVPQLFEANMDFAEWAGMDRATGFIQRGLEDGERLFNEHALDDFLHGVNPAHLPALQRLIRVCGLRDVQDLEPAFTGTDEVPFAVWGGYARTASEDLLILPELVANDDARVRLVALLAIWDMLDDCDSSAREDSPPGQLHVPPDLPKALDAARMDANPVIARLALCAAARTAHPAISPNAVIELLHDPRPVLRAAAARTVRHFSADVAPGDALAPLLGDPAASARMPAIQTVQFLGEPVATPAVLTSLLPVLDDTDHDVRIAAIEAATALGPALTDSFIERLADLTSEQSEVIRMRSIDALQSAKLRARRPSVYAALVECFEDPDSYVRECALRAYAELNGPGDEAVLEQVGAMLDDRTKGIRKAAAKLLARFGRS